jgi:hypothetical protein
MLRVLRAHDHAVPQLDIAAFANRLATHSEQNDGLKQEDTGNGKTNDLRAA